MPEGEVPVPKPSHEDRLNWLEHFFKEYKKEIDKGIGAVKSGGLKEAVYAYIAILIAVYGFLTSISMVVYFIPLAMVILPIVFSGYLKKLAENKSLIIINEEKEKNKKLTLLLAASEKENYQMRAEITVYKAMKNPTP